MPPFLGSKYRIFWSKAETVDRRDDIEHPGVRGCLEYFQCEDGIEVNHAGDLPARSGLGSSSAFVVGMLHALHALNGNRPSREQLAAQAVHVEQQVLCETVGIQDQIQCAWGGINVIRIRRDGGYMVEPVPVELEAQRHIESSLMLVFTGLQRFASEVAKAQIDNIKRKEAELLGIRDLVDAALESVRTADVHRLGRYLDETWWLKRRLSDKVSSSVIDSLYATAKAEGAWGGKLLGAGGGGFFLFCAPPERHARIAERLGMISIPVQFEHNGSQVVLAT